MLSLPAIRRRLAKFAFLRRVVHTLRWLTTEALRRGSPVVRWGAPRGLFSFEQEVRAQRLDGRIVREEGSLPAPVAGSLRQLCHDFQRQIDHRLYPVLWARLPQARLVGSTLVPLRADKRAGIEAMFTHAPDHDPGNHFLRLPPPVFLPGRWTSLVALFSNSYYHWVLEALPRLALLPELPADVGILVHGTLHPFQEESLRLLGLLDRVRRTPERHVVVEEFYFLSPASVLGTQHPESIRFLRDTFLPLADTAWTPPRSFFILRPGGAQGRRGVINEDEVRAMVEARGWTCLNPDRYPFSRQIHLFAQAERICGVHGGAMTNLVWCRPGTRMLELAAHNHLNGCFESLSERVGLNYQYTVIQDDADHRLQLDVADLARRLDAMG